MYPGGAVSPVRDVIGVEIADGAKGKQAIGTLQVEVLSVPAGGDRGAIAGLLLEDIDLFLKGVDVGGGWGWFWRGARVSRLRGVGNHSAGLDQVARCGGSLLLVHQHHLLDGRLEIGHFATQLFDLFLAGGFGGRLGLVTRRLIALGKSGRAPHKETHKQQDEASGWPSHFYLSQKKIWPSADGV